MCYQQTMFITNTAQCKH